MNRPLPEPARDVALLIARLLLGVVMFAHGYQKLVIDGLGNTTRGFESMSIPVAIVSAAVVTVVEIVGGVLVVVGALLTVVAACYLVVMVGAAVFVHIPHGIFVENGGWELVGVISALLLALAAAGSGRFGVDHVVRSRQPPATPVARETPVPVPVPAPVPADDRLDHAARPVGFVGPLPPAPVEPSPSADGEPSAEPLPVRSRRPRSWPGPSRSAHRH